MSNGNWNSLSQWAPIMPCVKALRGEKRLFMKVFCLRLLVMSLDRLFWKFVEDNKLFPLFNRLRLRLSEQRWISSLAA